MSEFGPPEGNRGGPVVIAAWLTAAAVVVLLAAAIAWVGSNTRLELREVNSVQLFPDRAAEGSLVDGPPRWRKQPAPDFPRRAVRAGVGSADVTLMCITRRSGNVSKCEVVRETPEGYGFGRAAVRAGNRSRVYPRVVDGRAERGTIRFTIRFRMPDEAPAPPAGEPAL